MAPNTPTAAELKFERRVSANAKRFDLRPLLDLLLSRGYQWNDFIFQSASISKSMTIVEDVTFERNPDCSVYITLNMGLLGDSSLLPSYFLEVVEKSPDPQLFFDFIRYFDHRLLDRFIRSLYPEDDDLLFRDWRAAKRSFLSTLGMGSIATLHWIFQLMFPDLKIGIHREKFSNAAAGFGVQTGRGGLDGSGVLGDSYTAPENGFVVDLIAAEEHTLSGRTWAEEVKARMGRLIVLLRPFRIPLAVRVVVLEHTSWLRVEKDGANRGQLGYDRLKVDEPSGHTMVIYRNQVAGGVDP